MHRVLAVILSTLILVVLGILLEGLLIKLPIGSKAEATTERIGVIHIHTKASDGGGTVAQVMVAAQWANLSFIAITDHNVAMTDSDLAEDPPDLPIISGEEVGTTAGHFLALGLPPSWTHPDTKNDRDLLAAARAVGAFRVLAHPFHPHTPWTDWQTSDFDGMEIWNEDATWRQNNVFDLMNSLLLYGVNHQLAFVRLARTPDENFAKWDELLEQRPVAGICAADTHGRIRLGLGHDVYFPDYVSSLKVAREHVLLARDAGKGDPSVASAGEILDALRHGHSFCALDSLYPANGFSFRVLSGNGSGGPGDSLSWAGAGRIQISVPSGASLPLIEVFRDGREIANEQSRTLDTPLSGPGRYRTEVFLRQPGLTGWQRWTLWAFTNPVYVTSK
ncbi:MAG TPA: CehA/McbA family metallohydrolase [Candidatus Acidoferrales bacterium]|nr:CehA/McbA family metallohydrolase [Candidatus Acidoferrales bacterium]